MENKHRLVRVSFWIDGDLREELNQFAKSISLSTSDLFKAGAIIMKNLIKGNPEINLNLFTRSFKDFENRQLQKKIQKAYKRSITTY